MLTAADLGPMIHGPLSATMFLAAPIAKLRPLADGDVRFAGEAVAMVIADSRYLAEDACELVDVAYEVLDPILDAALAADDPSTSSIPIARPTSCNARAPSTPTSTRCWPRPPTWSPPPSTSTASPRCRWSPTAWWPTGIRYRRRVADLVLQPAGARGAGDGSRVTGLAEHRIRATQRDVGGGFGQKGSMRTEEIAVVLAAYNLGMPLKWIEDRRENLIAGGHARSDRVTVTMGVDGDGRILGVRLDHVEDVRRASRRAAVSAASSP